MILHRHVNYIVISDNSLYELHTTCIYKEIIIFIIIYYILEVLQYLNILGGARVTFWLG